MRNLDQLLTEHLENKKKLVLLGVGSPLKADDAAGGLIAQAIAERFPQEQYPLLRVYNGESAPENFTGEIKRFAPELLLIVDAADLREQPGSVGLIDLEVIGGVSFSTHMLPLKIMLEYLRQEVGCEIMVLGIQPETTEYDGAISQPMQDAIVEVSTALTTALEHVYT